MLTVIMILCAMLCASACGGANAPATSDPGTSTDPSGNENDGGDGNNNNNEDKDDDPHSQYSDILKTVLTDSYYKKVIEDYSQSLIRPYSINAAPLKLYMDKLK